ncbi:hypothetical protein [Streptomyces sp. NPDC059994]|uniref:hypothetical protein n=1 Tax=Streptomyces sp. NPDC059994 TaxID=3347029 RepID=UPI0036B0B902
MDGFGLGSRIDTTALPLERRIRHSLEVARALSSNSTDEALAVLLEAEQAAPEQVRHHYLSWELVIGCIRGTRCRPSQSVAELARSLGVTGG